MYTKTEKSKETRYKILLENQNFLLNSVSENFVPSEQEFATSHTTHNSKSENVLHQHSYRSAHIADQQGRLAWTESPLGK